MNVAIVNISMGNVGSVEEAFRFLGAQVSLASTPEGLSKADLLVLAGVGNFKAAATKLRQQGFAEALDAEVRPGGRPILGICLGMQLFATLGMESADTPGFGWIPGRVVRLEGQDCKVPHIGWNSVTPVGKSFFPHGEQSYYFMHGYHFLPDDRSCVVATTPYCGLDLVSAVRRGNVLGVQFHPEKSQGDGLRCLKAVLEEFS